MSGVSGQRQEGRFLGGPRPLAALIPRVVRPAFRARAPAAAQVMADWDLIAGPALAAAAFPRRLAAGTLTLACSGPVALELQHMAAQLIERINTHLGQVVVRRLRMVQETRPAAPDVKRSPAPCPEARAASRRLVADLPEGELRDALHALGEALLSRRR